MQLHLIEYVIVFVLGHCGEGVDSTLRVYRYLIAIRRVLLVVQLIFQAAEFPRDGVRLVRDIAEVRGPLAALYRPAEDIVFQYVFRLVVEFVARIDQLLAVRLAVDLFILLSNLAFLLLRIPPVPFLVEGEGLYRLGGYVYLVGDIDRRSRRVEEVPAGKNVYRIARRVFPEIQPEELAVGEQEVERRVIGIQNIFFSEFSSRPDSVSLYYVDLCGDVVEGEARNGGSGPITFCAPSRGKYSLCERSREVLP